ncbi:hypothetical protein Tco_0623984 [Tanacetum coccineum]|uniref:Uncharacterized protein n=1 Tax=Tanacetum coccineum TaxID=301880 RepID=A0ABQ4WCS2_9ASTR
MSCTGTRSSSPTTKNTAAETSGHATSRSPWMQFEDTPIRSDVDETEEDDFENYFHDSPPQTPPRHHRQPPAPHHPMDPLRSLGIRTEIP